MRNFIVTVDGKQYEVGVEEIGASSAPAAAPVAAPVSAPKAAPAAPAASASGTKFTAPMPGMIKKLAVKSGTDVKEGDVIVVLEAMKMDNDLTAPCAGKITFNVSEGANVNTGDIIAVIG